MSVVVRSGTSVARCEEVEMWASVLGTLEINLRAFKQAVETGENLIIITILLMAYIYKCYKLRAEGKMVRVFCSLS